MASDVTDARRVDPLRGVARTRGAPSSASVKFSRRTDWDLTSSALDQAFRDLRRDQPDLIDLTESNLTSVGLETPRPLLRFLAEAAADGGYAPDARGALVTREAIAGSLGAGISPDDVIVTASTSEAYAWLFKLLCDGGDVVRVPSPSYPLFTYLAELEGVVARPYSLIEEEAYRLDVKELMREPDGVRGVVLVAPNNPTGTLLHREDVVALDAWASERGIALISDEVFSPFLHGPCPVHKIPTLHALDLRSLTFVLGGASKFLASPQIKVGWISVRGPKALRAAAIARLEVIADTYLSVSSAVQRALPHMLASASQVHHEIRARLLRNLETLDELLSRETACPVRRLPTDGGLTILLEVPRFVEDDAMIIALGRGGVLVMPGYFFDAPRAGIVVVSLIVEEAKFREGIRRLLRVIHEQEAKVVVVANWGNTRRPR
jgi:alanine-synthesizing transaminase